MSLGVQWVGRCSSFSSQQQKWWFPSTWLSRLYDALQLSQTLHPPTMTSQHSLNTLQGLINFSNLFQILHITSEVKKIYSPEYLSIFDFVARLNGVDTFRQTQSTASTNPTSSSHKQNSKNNSENPENNLGMCIYLVSPNPRIQPKIFESDAITGLV